VTVSLVVVVWVSVPAAPLIVTAKVPSRAREAVNLRSVDLPGVAGLLDQLGETPLGRPLTLIVVGLANPFTGLTVTDS
jgi:hypothetical protein